MDWLGFNVVQSHSIEELEEQAIERVSNACKAHLDIEKIQQVIDEAYSV